MGYGSILKSANVGIGVTSPRDKLDVAGTVHAFCLKNMTKLFDENYVGSLKLKNRITMSAMDLGFSNDGTINDKFIDFYEERAKGGVGMIVIGGCYPEYKGRVWKSIIALDKDEYIPGLKRFADTMHKYDTKAAAQILHGGRSAASFFTKSRSVSASEIPHALIKEIPHALTADEIKEVIQTYVDASIRLKKAGFDAVEIHGGMGYLINQFLSPASNKRTDRYGGSVENRTNFAKEVVLAIKKEAGESFPIIFRLSGDDFIEGGLKINESIQIAKILDDAGVDTFNISPGWHESSTPILIMSIPRSAYIFLAAAIKKNVKVPVIGSVRINDLAIAEEIINNNQADLISLGRPLIVDPGLPDKYKNGQYEDIRKCIACNQGCFDSLLNFRHVRCIYNVQAGMETEYKITMADKKKKIVIIGGGPAGMEAARVAALRGHHVSLYEKKDYLGGQLRYAYMPYGREEIENVINYLETQIRKLKVKITLNKEADEKIVEMENPDAIIISVGAVPIIPPIPGIDGKNVFLACDALDGKVNVGQDVVIIGGGTIGCETALDIAKIGAMSPDVACYLLKNGVIDKDELIEYISHGAKNVTILEMKRKLGSGFGKSTKWVILKEIKDAGVNNINKVKVLRINDIWQDQPNKDRNPDNVKKEIIYELDGKEKSIRADTVILAAGYKANNTFAEQFNGKFSEVYSIGDCRNVETAMGAIHEGFKVGLSI